MTHVHEITLIRVGVQENHLSRAVDGGDDPGVAHLEQRRPAQSKQNPNQKRAQHICNKNPIESKHRHQSPNQQLLYSPVSPRDDADLGLELPHLCDVNQQHGVRLGYACMNRARCCRREKGKVSVTSLGRRPSTRKPVRGFTYSIAGFAALSSCSGGRGRGFLWGFLNSPHSGRTVLDPNPTTPARAFFGQDSLIW